MHALFSLNGQEFMCIDSNVKHDFTFTPAMSLYVTCDTEAEEEIIHKRRAMSEKSERDRKIFQSYLENIKAKTGKTPDDFRALVKENQNGDYQSVPQL